MKRIAVASSNVRSIGYDSETRTLEVEFKGGSVYEYYDVEPEVYSEFMKAPSKGRFLWNNIRDVYDYQRIE